MSDVLCPYCEKEIEICHDDGHGLDESTVWEDRCPHCDKAFVFTTMFSVDHFARKADCLNGDAPHDWKPSMTFPRRYTRMRCSVCDADRVPTLDEWHELLVESETR